MTTKTLLLANPIKDLDAIRFPVLASPKIDGVRCVIGDGKALSRNFKEIPNQFVQQQIGLVELNGIDGELTCGSPTANDVFTQTMSGVMREDEQPDFTFWVFDNASPDSADKPFEDRLSSIVLHLGKFAFHRVKVIPHKLCLNLQELLEYQEKCLAEGFEGIMVRDPNGKYKYGRSTPKEQILQKLKKMTRSEAKIVGYKERMHNGNEKVLQENGKMKRTTHKAGKVGRGDLGAWIMEWKGGKTFDCGSGMTDEQRAQYWIIKDKIVADGEYGCFEHFEIGDYELPRQPIFKGLRHKIDLPVVETRNQIGLGDQEQ